MKSTVELNEPKGLIKKGINNLNTVECQNDLEYSSTNWITLAYIGVEFGIIIG